MGFKGWQKGQTEQEEEVVDNILNLESHQTYCSVNEIPCDNRSTLISAFYCPLIISLNSVMLAGGGVCRHWLF